MSENRDDIFDGRGAPLTAYKVREEDWPAVWRLPDGMFEQDGDLFEKMATLTDDMVLRTAVNCWDNCIRAPGAFEGVAGGVLSAHARLVVGLLAAGEFEDIERAADITREAWLGMARQALAVNKGGWESARLNDNEG